MPSEFSKNSELTATELDDLTGRIAKQLYQHADIEIKGFQDRKMPDNYFDLAITNVPFSGEIRPYDSENKKRNYLLHNFFFAKAMDKVRPGGLVAFITSTGTMQSESAEAQKLRAEMNSKADLIAAFKLPNTAFEKNAGTQVTTDILILQKRLEPLDPSPYAQDWQEILTIKVENENLDINEYFKKNPSHMIGKLKKDTMYGGYGAARLALDGKGYNVEKELEKLMEQLPENIFKPVQMREHDSLKNTRKVIADSETQNFSFTEKGGKFYQKDGNELVEVDAKNQSAVKDYLPLMKSVHNILNAQLTPETTDKKLSELRQSLHKNYDNFVKNHGYLNAQKNKKILGSDPNYGSVAAIENYNYDKKTKKESAKKADIFFKRTVSPIIEPTSADTVEEGLYDSLSIRGHLDMEYIHKLTGKTKNEIIKELGDKIYKNPETNLHELAEEYLSGNVREKLEFAKEAARHNPEFQRNVAALEKVLPRDLTENEINIRLGSTFIDTKYYEDFIRHMIKIWYNGKVAFNSVTGQYFIYGTSYTNENQSVWGMQGNSNWTFLKLLERIMNYSDLKITYTDPETKRSIVDGAKTEAAKAKAIQKEFENWIWADEERKKNILRTYNDKFNSYVERRYSGEHLNSFLGLTETVKEKLYPHQKDVIYRNLQGGNTLIGHCVGAGKTWAMVISGMKMKQLGLIRKPLYAVPNNIVGQFKAEFLQAYPSAKLLVLDSKSLPLGSSKGTSEKPKAENRAKRRATLSKIATGDWDGIIISHEVFEKLPLSAETYKKFADEQIALLEAERRENADDPNGKRFIKALEEAIANLESDLKRMTDIDAKEIIMPFEELGIDQIFVDESDLFKNLKFTTNIQAKGISTTGSKRAWDLFTKTRWLSKQRNGGGVIFATGTPVSNTLNEIFTLQRFLDYDGLVENDLQTFGKWIKNFGRLETSVELSSDGTDYKPTNRVSLLNAKSLRTMCGKFMDIKVQEDLPHLKRPKVERIQEVVEPTNRQIEYTKKIGIRAQAVRDRKVNPTEDNLLKINGDWRKASIDMRLVDPTTPPSEAGGKIPKLCDNVFKNFEETTNVKGTQLIFLDLGTPKAKSKKNKKDNNDTDIAENIDDNEDSEDDSALTAADMSLYENIRDGLIMRGIPRNQIAFVHEAKTAEQKKALFEKVNEGEIKVILGSTQKMGAGTNFQKHLVALHHLDCPWRPRDIEQREGRILRAGNLNEKVKIYTYLTKNSSDGFSWEKMKIKQQMITGFLRGKISGTEIDAIDELTLNAGEAVALASGDPKIKERSELENKVNRLKLLQINHFDNQRRNQEKIKDLERRIPFVEKQLENLKLDAKEKVDVKGDAFKMKISDKIFDDRKEASEAYSEALKNISGSERKKIGEIGGFDIEVSKIDGDSVPFVFLKNHGSYNVTGTVQSMANFISGIQKEIDKVSNALEKNKKELAEIKSRPTKFDKQAELDEAIRKLAEIDNEIKATSDNTNANTAETNKKFVNIT